VAANTTTPRTAVANDRALSVDDALSVEIPCACRAVLVDGEPSGCTRVTKRTFAPGHDAQLKSRMIKAEVAGSKVAWVADPKTAVSVYEVAGEHGFGHQVRDGVVRAQRLQQEKADRKAARDTVREANRATREAAKAEAAAKRQAEREAKAEALAQRVADKANKLVAGSSPKLVQAKVGRWIYEGTVGKDGSFSFRTKSGEAKTRAKGTYELLGA